MTYLARTYFLTLYVLGVGLFIGTLVWALPGRASLEIGSLIAISVVAAWLRFALQPIGYVTLVPLISFSALLLSEPSVAILISPLAAFIGGSALSRAGWSTKFAEVGEEILSTVLSVGIYQLISSYAGPFIAITSAAGGYAITRLILTGLRGELQEGIALRSTVIGAGPHIVGNVLLLAIVAFGVTRGTSIYDRFGLLGLSLLTIALVEFYRPWKLLSQQSDDLYTSLAIIAEAIDIKDPYTGRHSRRVAEMSTRLARRLNLPEDDVGTIRMAALLHDIGKIGVSGRIIRKPGLLESTELRAMQRHPVISADIMSPVEYFAGAARLVRHHHEHYDGSGYPDGLRGEDIPIGARIILVADAFDAMVTDRPYRKGRTYHEALNTLRERAGKQFDTRVVNALHNITTG